MIAAATAALLLAAVRGAVVDPVPFSTSHHTHSTAEQSRAEQQSGDFNLDRKGVE